MKLSWSTHEPPKTHGLTSTFFGAAPQVLHGPYTGPIPSLGEYYLPPAERKPAEPKINRLLESQQQPKKLERWNRCRKCHRRIVAAENLCSDQYTGGWIMIFCTMSFIFSSRMNSFRFPMLSARITTSYWDQHSQGFSWQSLWRLGMIPQVRNSIKFLDWQWPFREPDWYTHSHVSIIRLSE